LQTDSSAKKESWQVISDGSLGWKKGRSLPHVGTLVMESAARFRLGDSHVQVLRRFFSWPA
jgi:hypothetical protein